MATQIGQLKNSESSEAKAILRFREILPDSVHLTANLNLIGVPEIDCLLIHPTIGNFLIEIKSFRIDQIENVVPFGFKIFPSPQFTNKLIIEPVSQVRNQFFALQQYLHARGYICPYFLICVALPYIKRADWVEKFGESDESLNYIFSEDLEDKDCLEKRLEWNADFPFQGRKVSLNVRVRKPDQNKLVNLCANGFKISPHRRENEHAPALFENPKKPEHRGEKSILDIQRVKLYEIRGKAGTGKTFRLLKWANYQSDLGKNVLVVTFNNALAAELRRINAGRNGLINSGGLVIINSISELLRKTELRFGIVPQMPESDEFDVDKWNMRLIIASEKQWPDIEKFDCIAIDEGQDINDLQWNLVKAMSKNDSQWSIVWAENQNLYVEDLYVRKLEIYKFIKSLNEEDVKKAPMDKPYRSTSESWLLGQVHGDLFGRVKISLNANEFQREVTASLVKNRDVSHHASLLDENIPRGLFFANENTSSVHSLIDEMILRVKDLGSNASEMILFYSKKDPNYRVVKEYLEQKKCNFVDFVSSNPNDRFTPVAPEFIRLSTIHRVRGIDATNTLIFGIHKLNYESFEAKDVLNRTGKNLAYIALTRAKFGTYLISDEFKNLVFQKKPLVVDSSENSLLQNLASILFFIKSSDNYNS